jgi:flagellar hook-associated protein 3 FlgL
MRITNNMLINNMINYIGNNLTRMDKYQNQLATGKKISVPSDDPVVAARALKLRTDVAEIDQYQKNTKDAQSWLDTTEDALAKMGDIIQRARELAVEAANGTNTPDDTQKIEEEAKQLRTQLIHLGNSTYAGRYIFSGYKTDTKLFDEETGAFLISVENSENIKYEIGIGDDININVTGGDLFNNGAAAVGNTSGVTAGKFNISTLTMAAPNNVLSLNVDGDVFSINIAPDAYPDVNALAAQIQTQINGAKQPETAGVTVTAIGGKLQFKSGSTGPASYVAIDTGASTAAGVLGLSENTQVNGTASTKGAMIADFDRFISLLDAGDYTGISDMLSDFDNDMNNVLRVRADVGARINRIELTANRLDSDEINFTKLMSTNEDVDMVDAIMNLQNEENVYRASLSGGARIIQPTLLDFLK